MLKGNPRFTCQITHGIAILNCISVSRLISIRQSHVCASGIIVIVYIV